MERKVDGDMITQMSQMGRPIPGQSLTNDPDNPAPFEKAPKITNQRQAIEFIFSKLTTEEVYIPIMGLLDEGMGVMTVVQNILYQGFREGFWNPDMMLLVAEPTAYMVMSLAERAGIDYVIDDNEQEDEQEEEELFGSKTEQRKLDTLRKTLDSKGITQATANVLPAAIAKSIDTMELPSLVEKPGASEMPEDEEASLIEKPANA